MTTLDIYRDDGPLAHRLLARLSAADRPPRPLEWLVPPILRALEYGALIALAAATDAGALPFCFALLGVLAFHHYDTAYRLRHQGIAPPAWLSAVGGGWEGRLLVALVLAFTGGLRYAFLAAAVGLALVYATESTASWLRFGRGQGAVLHEDEDVDGD